MKSVKSENPNDFVVVIVVMSSREVWLLVVKDNWEMYFELFTLIW